MSVFDVLEGEGLEKFNTGRGRKITYSQDPDVEYSFPETDIEIYSHDPSMTDIVHPFKPSSEYLVQAVQRGFFHYFEGSEEDMKRIDRKLTRELDGLDPSKNYKIIDMS